MSAGSGDTRTLDQRIADSMDCGDPDCYACLWHHAFADAQAAGKDVREAAKIARETQRRTYEARHASP